MTTKTPRQNAYILIDHFVKLYRKRFGVAPPRMNRHALASGFEGLHKDYLDQAYAIIDHYVNNYKEPDPFKFTYAYGDVFEDMENERRDREDREELHRRTIERVLERRRVVNESSERDISSDQE